MKTSAINNIIENFNALQFEDKELAAEIIRKAYAASARDIILKKAILAERNLKKGKVKKGNIKDLYKDLEDD